MKKGPCYGCEPPKRTLYCHSHCAEYAQWCEEQKEVQKQKRRNYAQSDAAKRMFWKKIKEG